MRKLFQAIMILVALLVIFFVTFYVATEVKLSKAATATVGQVAEVELVDASAHSPPSSILVSFGRCTCGDCQSKLYNSLIDINTDDRNVLNANQLAKFPVHLYSNDHIRPGKLYTKSQELPVYFVSGIRGKLLLGSVLVLKCPTEAAGLAMPC